MSDGAEIDSRGRRFDEGMQMLWLAGPVKIAYLLLSISIAVGVFLKGLAEYRRWLKKWDVLRREND